MSATQRDRSAHRLSELKLRAWLRRASPGDSLHDGGGLYLRVRETGAFWSLRQVNATTGSRTFASLFDDGTAYPARSLEEARKKVAEMRRAAGDAGTDTVRLRRRQRDEKRAREAAEALASSRRRSVRQLFADWKATDLTPKPRADGTRTGRKDGGAELERLFESRVFPVVGDLPAADLRKGDLLPIIDQAKADGRLRTANVLLGALKQMYRFALVRELVDRNPLDTVTKKDAGGKETERDRVLSAAELRSLAEKVPPANMNARSALAVWAILGTACRVGELMCARWEHVDLESRTWHLPDTKNGREHTIHLSDFALDQFRALAARKEVRLDGRVVPWVFPNTAGDGPVSIATFGKQLADRQRPPERRMKNRTKATGALALDGGRWTAHDLRRTAATVMAELGVSGDVIDECLNHKIENRVRRTYIRDRRLSDQARAFDALGSRLRELLMPASQTNVVPFTASARAARG